MNRIDPWCQIVGGLRGRAADATHSARGPAIHDAVCELPARCNPMPRTMATASSIRHIEWQTASTILVSWSDARLGLFQDQTWRVGVARRQGTCALTGVPVRRGDVVFRPLARAGTTPMNASDMILAATLSREARRAAG